MGVTVVTALRRLWLELTNPARKCPRCGRAMTLEAYRGHAHGHIALDWLMRDDRLYWAIAAVNGHAGGSTSSDEARGRALLHELARGHG
jgi:hypothetical protein